MPNVQEHVSRSEMESRLDRTGFNVLMVMETDKHRHDKNMTVFVKGRRAVKMVRDMLLKAAGG